MTAKGFDTDMQLTAAQYRRAVAAGYVAVGRYLKNLSPQEIAAAAGAGMKLWLIDEGWGNAAVFAGGSTRGAEDGARAKDKMAEWGIAPGTVVYFAIDYDATADDVDNIRAYFGGYSQAAAPYVVGMYADGEIASAIPTQVGDYVPGAGGWEGTAEYLQSGKVALIQRPPETLLGLDADPVDIVDESVLWDPGTVTGSQGGEAVPPSPSPGAAPPVQQTPPAPSSLLPPLVQLQQFLGITADGIFGPETAAAIENWYEVKGQ